MDHKKLCTNKNECAIKMPSPESNFVFEMKFPFIIFADTGSLLKQPEKLVFSPDCKTQAIQQHEIHSIGYYFMDANEKIKSYYESHRGPNCVNRFMDQLINVAIDAFDFLETKRKMNALTKEQEIGYHSATECHIRKKHFIAIRNDKTYHKVRDHCHLSGQYRGPAHST